MIQQAASTTAAVPPHSKMMQSAYTKWIIIMSSRLMILEFRVNYSLISSRHSTRVESRRDSWKSKVRNRRLSCFTASDDPWCFARFRTEIPSRLLSNDWFTRFLIPIISWLMAHALHVRRPLCSPPLKQLIDSFQIGGSGVLRTRL